MHGKITKWMAGLFLDPGVYITEKDAFPNIAEPVATAVPAFIGYTEKALRGNRSIKNEPTRITSLSDFHQLFGKAPKTTYILDVDGESEFKVEPKAVTKFNLYHSMRLFFSNGGGTCYIVSVGNYDYEKGVNYKDLNDEDNGSGIPTLLKEAEPTMLVIPDAVLLEDEKECSLLQKDMLRHCGNMKNRVALLDVYHGEKARSYDEDDVINRARNGFGMEFLQWGACYYPHLQTSIVQDDEVDFTNIHNLETLASLLNAEADALTDEKARSFKDEIAKLGSDDDHDSLHQTLLAVSPRYKSVLAEIKNDLNILPPSGGMASVITMTDHKAGVFISPANVSMNSVIEPTVHVTSEEQEDLSSPPDGKAINAIRSFIGEGVLVWEAHTLDSHSKDWKYLSVRRTAIMMEQSLKLVAKAYVFEPNDENTWSTLKGIMTHFLNEQWKQGALAGSTPEDAFSVDIGLGTTMTPADISKGKMIVSVKLAISKPAEFTVITFIQQMQKA